jgi:hypothetical protein
VYHRATGRALTFYDSLVRAGFEFLPLAWLRVYRLLKYWLANPSSGVVDEKTSYFRDLKMHWPTILASTAALAAIIFIHLHANPHLLFILFYGLPCALLALVVNKRWATLFVVISSVVSPWVQYDGDSDYRSTGVFVWNLFSRFILLEILVLTIGRIRLDFSRTGHHVK